MSTEDNKKIVLEFEEVAFNQKDAEKAAKYLADNYTQHNPNFADGIEGFKGGLQWLAGQYPHLKVEVKQIFADKDYIIIHVYGDTDATNPNGEKVAIVDIFRVKNGKIVEHWDVIQPIPAESKNSNGMF
jgi:predicted SnoaL-like aldol condensation-catalyzing enzyme